MSSVPVVEPNEPAASNTSTSSSNTIHAAIDYINRTSAPNDLEDEDSSVVPQQLGLDLQVPAACYRPEANQHGRDFHRFEVLEDDTSTTYSYFSTWSSNHTASNLPGPGRILGNIYEWAGDRVFGSVSSRRGRTRRRQAVTNDSEDAARQESALEEGRGVFSASEGQTVSRQLTSLPLPPISHYHSPHPRTPAPAHSYFSTWSTNYTRSNLPGPGRVLGNLFSSAGSALERQLGRLAYRMGVGRYAKAEVDFSHMGLFYLKMQKGTNSQEMCELLLGYARSDNPAIQFMAFQQIVGHIVHTRQPARRLIYEACFQKSSSFLAAAAPAEAQTFAWKRPGVEYSAGWLYMYRLASLCVLVHANPVMDAVGELVGKYNLDQQMLGFGEFEEMFARCRHSSDDALALRILAHTWNGKGLDVYVQAHGYDTLLLRLATALRVPYEVASSDPSPFGVGAAAASFVLIFAMDFMRAMWASLRELGKERCDALAAEEEEGEGDGQQRQMAVWVEFFVMYCILRSRVGLQLSPGAVSLRCETWAEECYRELQDDDPDYGNRQTYTRVRHKLLELEDIHGEAIRARFPPEDPVVIAETLANIPK